MMIDKKRVALMTRLAIHEKQDNRKAFISGSFFMDDYLTKELWEAFFAITLTYALVVVVGLIAWGDTWTVSYHIADVLVLVKKLLLIYLALLAAGLLLCFISHLVLFRKAEVWRDERNLLLKRLDRLYKAEEDQRMPEATSHGKEQEDRHGYEKAVR